MGLISSVGRLRSESSKPVRSPKIQIVTCLSLVTKETCYCSQRSNRREDPWESFRSKRSEQEVENDAGHSDEAEGSRVKG